MTRTTSAVKFCFVISLLSFLRIFSADARLVINEVAYKGSGENTCDKDDWIELLNTDEEVVDLTSYMLHDDNGKDDEDATIFAGVTVAPGEFLILCKDKDFKFSIGIDDTISLLDPTGIPVDSVTLPGIGANDETYAYVDGEYKYTITPTPGEANVYTEPASMEEKLQAQNDAGNSFFLLEGVQTFSKVVDIYVSMEEESLVIIEDHPAWEEYVPFNKLSVSNIRDTNINEEPFTISSGGKIRTKGQWTNSITACVGLKNIPFQIKFDTPFMGIETMYLRNHQDDYSFMRDHASHTMLKAFGLPYLRTRPVRLFLNGGYVGFYTLMEDPTQEYVMHRSFGAFDPEKTALFKAKTSMADCPFTISPSTNATSNLPDPYYFERGDHREDIPVLGFEGYGQCVSFYLQERSKENVDEARGYLEYDKNCGLAMVKMGLVDRDYGPKLMEEPMIDFLESKFYNETNDDLTDSIDTDQWLQNLAVYAVMLNMDSPMGIINNWFLATTNGGVNDWKIVQYDHNGVTTRSMVDFGCDQSCGPRMVYWPILQPTCGSIKDHKIVGRVLNSEENIQIYLDYVQEYVNILTTGDVLEKVYDYGNIIKEYVMEDPWNHYPTMEAYEESELGTNIQDYNTDESPFLKTIQVRLQQVQKQLDAIQDGTLPFDGVYNEGSVCPDWRDESSEDNAPGFNAGDESSFLHSGTFVESETCGSGLSECVASAECFDHNSGICAYDGEILTVECQVALPLCRPCFPYSRCSSSRSPDAPQGGGGKASGAHWIIVIVVTGLSWCWILA